MVSKVTTYLFILMLSLILTSTYSLVKKTVQISQDKVTMKQINVRFQLASTRMMGIDSKNAGIHISKLRTVFISDQCFLFSDPPKQSKFACKYVYLYVLKYVISSMECG